MGGTQGTKGKITPMMNGPFIFKADIKPSRIFCVSVASLKTLRIWFQRSSTVLLIYPVPVSVCVFGVREYEGRGVGGIDRLNKK